jgi:hypothetical protein
MSQPDSIFAAIASRDAGAVSAFLLAHPEVVSQLSPDGRSPLMCGARLRAATGVLLSLLDAGANCSTVDAAGRTALHHAAAGGDADAVRALMARGGAGGAAAVTVSGNTPLHRAAAYGHLAALDVLLGASRAQLDVRNKEGATPMSRAARWGHLEVVRALLRAGANAEIADSRGFRPVEWASAKGFARVADILKGEGGGEGMGGGANGMGGGKPLYVSAGGGGGGGGLGAQTPVISPPVLGAGVPAAGVSLRVEGWMAKEGHFLRTWRVRWFVLEGRTMMYYTREGAAKPQGIIKLLRGSEIVIAERYVRPFCFTLITKAKRFILQVSKHTHHRARVFFLLRFMIEFIHSFTLTPPLLPSPPSF